MSAPNPTDAELRTRYDITPELAAALQRELGAAFNRGYAQRARDCACTYCYALATGYSEAGL